MVSPEHDLAEVSICMVALYLPGWQGSLSVQRSRSLAVEALLRRRGPSLGAASACLAQGGFPDEAVVLQTPSLLARSEALIAQGGAISSVCASYPLGWHSLGNARPPAAWVSAPPEPGPSLAIVGSREPSEPAASFTQAVALEARSLGLGVLSGGAPGCDSLAAQALGGDLLEIIPCGLSVKWGHPSARKLSVRPPGEPFSRAAAMERNLLLYACSGQSVVCASRFKAGGTWTGATEALLRGAFRVLVRQDGSCLALRSLIALGGTPLSSAQELRVALEAPALQGSFRFA